MCIHASSVYQNIIYILNLIYKSIRRFALRNERMHTGSMHESSIYLIKYVFVASVCCCSVLVSGLGSGYCVLVIVFLLQHQIEGLSK